MRILLTIVTGFLTPINTDIRTQWRVEELDVPDGQSLVSLVNYRIKQAKSESGTQVISVCHSIFP